MTETTITEALADIKTIGKRIDKKRQAILSYLARDVRMRDPLEAEGGSGTFIERERQAIGDLEARTIKLRTAIQRKNLATPLVVNGTTRTVAEWLTWRREISQGSGSFLGQMSTGIHQLRRKMTQEGHRVVSSESKAEAGDIIVNISEQDLAKQLEGHEQTMGELDGKLSLLNATTMISVGD